MSAPRRQSSRREAPLGRPATGRGRILAPDVPGVALTYKPTGISARRGRARRRPRLSPGDRGRRTRLRASPRPHRQTPPRRSTPLLAPGNGSTLAVGSRPRANRAGVELRAGPRLGPQPQVGLARSGPLCHRSPRSPPGFRHPSDFSHSCGGAVSHCKAVRAASRRRSSTRACWVRARSIRWSRSTPSRRASVGATVLRASQRACLPRIPSATFRAPRACRGRPTSWAPA